MSISNESRKELIDYRNQLNVTNAEQTKLKDQQLLYLSAGLFSLFVTVFTGRLNKTWYNEVLYTSLFCLGLSVVTMLVSFHVSDWLAKALIKEVDKSIKADSIPDHWPGFPTIRTLLRILNYSSTITFILGMAGVFTFFVLNY